MTGDPPYATLRRTRPIETAEMSKAPPAAATVRGERDGYLRENQLTMDGYTAAWVKLPVGWWVLPVPNPAQRRRALPRHDLHHVATGYPTDWIGEIQISSWEVGAGLGGLWIAWAICVPFFLVGLVRCPSRTLAAFREGRRCRSLFVDDAPYNELLAMKVGELRQRIGLPQRGLT